MNRPPDAIRPLRERHELVQLARELGVRPDWHEPDEQDVTARVEGTPLNFDNAMGVGHWYPGFRDEPAQAELHVVLCRKLIEDGIARRGPDIATVNLATLFAWASEEPPTTGAGVLRAEVDRLQRELDKLKATLRRLGGAA